MQLTVYSKSMVFIQLDTGIFKEFTAPCEITIGRGETNDLQPESQSVSKAHATIHLAVDPLKNSIGDDELSKHKIYNHQDYLFFKTIDAFLEDLNSRNGSFIGSSPLELSRVAKGTKASISFGDYIRFGHSQKLFRYLEKIPPSPLPIVEQPSLEEEDELQVLPTEQGMYLSAIVCTKCFLNYGIWFDTCYFYTYTYIYTCTYK